MSEHHIFLLIFIFGFLPWLAFGAFCPWKGRNLLFLAFIVFGVVVVLAILIFLGLTQQGSKLKDSYGFFLAIWSLGTLFISIAYSERKQPWRVSARDWGTVIITSLINRKYFIDTINIVFVIFFVIAVVVLVG